MNTEQYRGQDGRHVHAVVRCDPYCTVNKMTACLAGQYWEAGT